MNRQLPDFKRMKYSGPGQNHLLPVNMSYLSFNELPSSNNFPFCIRYIKFVFYVMIMQYIDITSMNVYAVIIEVVFFGLIFKNNN